MYFMPSSPMCYVSLGSIRLCTMRFILPVCINRDIHLINYDQHSYKQKPFFGQFVIDIFIHADYTKTILKKRFSFDIYID